MSDDKELTVVPTPPRAPMTIAHGVLLDPTPMERREFQLPKLPPGVVPIGAKRDALLASDDRPNALDDATTAPLYSWANGFGGLGFGLGFQGYTYLAELSQLSEYRVPSETLASEMTRKWIKFKTTGDVDDQGAEDTADKLEQIEQAFKDFKIKDVFQRCAELDSFFGCGHMFIDIDKQSDPDRRKLPLIVDPVTIKKGSLKGFKPIEPYWASPYAYDSIDPASESFYKPRSWFVVGIQTHATRLLQFISRPVPDLLKPAYNFGGISLTQLMEPYVQMWLRTRKSVNDLIHQFSVPVLATDMNAILAGSNDNSSLVKRAQLFNQTRDNRGLMLVNKDTEEFLNVSTPLSGLSELQAQSQEHMSAPSQIPLVKLFGITPSGLNASSDSEIQVFYDHIRSRQESLFRPKLSVVLNIVQLHLFGTIDDSIDFEFVPLDEPDGEALARIRKSDAEAGAAYINAGVISPEEERDRLKHDPLSGYDGLEGEAPEPPEPTVSVDPETGKPLEQPASNFGGGDGGGGDDDGDAKDGWTARA